jgi:hypothetical protein
MEDACPSIVRDRSHRILKETRISSRMRTCFHKGNDIDDVSKLICVTSSWESELGGVLYYVLQCHTHGNLRNLRSEGSLTQSIRSKLKSLKEFTL